MTNLKPEIALQGPWSLDEIASFFCSVRVPMRLAANGASGFPMVTPVWHLWADGEIWAASRPSSALVRRLRDDPRCAFEISCEQPPYKGVRGRGIAEIEANGEDVLKQLLGRFMGAAAPNFQARLLEAAQDECAIRIRPSRLTSWDFGRRMAK